MVSKTQSLYMYVGLFLIVVAGVLLLFSTLLTFWRYSSTVVDEKFVIPPAHDREICRSFPSDTVLTIYVNVLSGGDRDIDFLIRDEEVYRSNPGVSETTIEWSPPPNREICFVYINKDLNISRTVYTKIVEEVYRFGRYSTILPPIVVALYLVGIAMLLLYWQKSRAS